MKTLQRKVEYASWSWTSVIEPDHGEMANMMKVAGQVTRALMEERILTPSQIDVRWKTTKEMKKLGVFTTQARVTRPNSIESLGSVLQQGCPQAYANAPIKMITISGSGYWATEEGEETGAWGLATVNLSPFEDTVWAELVVHDDIWSTHDFAGHPQPNIYHYNAPRLERVIREIERITDDETSPGDPTDFATPDRYGIEDPITENGFAQDTTQWL